MKKINMTLGSLALLAVVGFVSTGCGAASELSEAQVKALKTIADLGADKVDNSKVAAGVSASDVDTKIQAATAVLADFKLLVDKGLLKKVTGTAGAADTYELADALKIASKSTELGVTFANAAANAAAKSAKGKKIEINKDSSTTNSTTFVDTDFITV